MINALVREHAVRLITKAVNSGARLFKACEELGISKRTFNRWSSGEETDELKYVDRRTVCERPEPANKLSRKEKEAMLEIVHSKEYGNLPQYQIVPRLEYKGIYIASESIFKTLKYRPQFPAERIFNFRGSKTLGKAFCKLV